MPTFPFKQVDVFTHTPYRGNPVAVVLDGKGLSSEQMQRIANWTNLSETTFVLEPTQPGADYRVRIFTPQSELPFAGHPTLGTAHALLEAGIIAPTHGKLVQECAAGLIALNVTPSNEASPVIDFQLPVPGFRVMDSAQVDELAAILGAEVPRVHRPQHITVGPTWTIVEMPSADAVRALRPDFARMAAFDRGNLSIGIVVYGAQAPGAASAIEVRAFAPSVGVNEDPVCGSGNGAVAAYIRATGQVATFGASYVATQGVEVGRSGRIFVTFDGDERIRIGGQSVTCVEGRIAA